MSLNSDKSTAAKTVKSICMWYFGQKC